MSINNISIINNAYSALEIAQAGMTITSQNVSGANVEGFSRRRANNVIGLMAPTSRDFGSTAFAVEGFTRFIDNLLTKQMLDQRSKTSYTNTLLQSVAGLDSLMMDPASSISAAVSKFLNAAGTLANDDQSLTNKQNFAGAAELLANRISSFNTYLGDVKKSTQINFTGILNKANSLAPALRSINQKILASSSPGYSTPSADLLDERDRITMRLQDLMGGTTIINEDGTATFQIGGVSLVDRMHANQFVNTDIGVSDGALFNVFMKNEQTGYLVGPLSTNVRDSEEPYLSVKTIFTAGQAGGAFEILSNFLPKVQRELSAFTVGLFRDVNYINYDPDTYDPDNIDESITQVFGFKSSGGTSTTFFPSEYADALLETDENGFVMKIEDIMDAADPSSQNYDPNIAAIVNNRVPGASFDLSSFVSMLSYGPDIVNNFPIEASAANRIEQLRSSLTNPLSLITSDVATTISSWKSTDKVNQVIAKQLSDRRESISGVNLDEEAANLVKFQQMYAAASKVMQTANQMFNLLLNMLSE